VGPGEAASEVARDFGIEVEEPILLQDTNNTVFWLAPSPVVAKVGTGKHDRLDRELITGMALEEASAPVVGPSRLVPRAVHQRQGYRITFWQYVAESGGDLEAPSVASALGVLHAALARIEGSGGLPAFSEELDLVERRLNDPRFAPALNEADRRLLLDALELVAPSDDLDNVLHGSPHRFNILSAQGSPRFIDFETVCRGPIEWDLAHLEPAVAEAYPGTIDSQLLARCTLVVSAKTAAWCWDQADQNDDMRWHASHHLDVIREALS
jgi:Phosphotransferase enzyme family